MTSFVKKLIALFLLFIVASYSVDLHGLSHAFENDYANDDKQCEICILHHQNHETSVSILPLNDYAEDQFLLDNIKPEIDFSSYAFVYKNLYFEGQFFNKPPPLNV